MLWAPSTTWLLVAIYPSSSTSIPDPATYSVCRPRKPDTAISEITETTEGITSVTTGRKAGKEIAGSLCDGKAQSGSVCWAVLFVWGALGDGETNRVHRVQPPTVNTSVATITAVRMYFLDIFRYTYYSIVVFSPEKLWPNSRLGVSDHSNKADLTIQNATLYNEKKLRFAPPLLGPSCEIWFSLYSCNKQ